MNKIISFLINFIITFLFGVRIEGEPIDLSYPAPTGELPPVDPAFFEWSKEYKVGCQTKGKPVFY